MYWLIFCYPGHVQKDGYNLSSELHLFHSRHHLMQFGESDMQHTQTLYEKIAMEMF